MCLRIVNSDWHKNDLLQVHLSKTDDSKKAVKDTNRLQTSHSLTSLRSNSRRPAGEGP